MFLLLSGSSGFTCWISFTPVFSFKHNASDFEIVNFLFYMVMVLTLNPME